jgi:KilA-N domain
MQALNLNGIDIEYRASDGFVNATQLCKAGGKVFSKWYRLISIKELIREFEAELNNTHLLEISNSKYKSIWINPDLTVALAQWISPKFKFLDG